MPDITFKTWEPYFGTLEEPMPATKCVPEYYKKMDMWVHEPKVYNHNQLSSGMTMKACIPIRDLLTAGYIISLWEELFVEKRVHNESDDGRVFSFAGTADGKDVTSGTGLSTVEAHGIRQFQASPLFKKARDKETGNRVPKMSCPWTFHTPPGYSCLFLPPQYRENRIEILPAIVDTDKWHLVQFPFLFNGFKDKETVPIGEPVIQVIPFKRENWKIKVQENKSNRASLLYSLFRKLTSAYHKFHHTKKNWR